MKKILTFILALVTLCSLSIPALALESTLELQAANVALDIVSYYPVVESYEWDSMTRQERVAACQISEEMLETMPTDDLLQIVLEYPFMIDLYAFNTYAEGFQHVYNEFPALEELSNRNDFGAVIVEVYKEAPVASTASIRSESSVGYENIKTLSIMDIFLAQPEMTDNLAEEVIISLVDIAEKKYLEKIEEISVNSGNLITFYEAVNENNESTIYNVVAAATATTFVLTPNGSSVSVYNYSGITDWSSAEISTLNLQHQAAYPNATRVSNPSKKYNCHSYAWYSASTSNYYWMNNPSLYMSDGSYKKTSSAGGNRVYWGNCVHSGIISASPTATIYCNSKWGQLGVYKHKVTESPYSGTLSYWAKA